MSDIITPASKFKINLRLLKLGGIYSGIAGLMTDILKPWVEFTHVFLVLVIACLIIELALEGAIRFYKNKQIPQILSWLDDLPRLSGWFGSIFLMTVLSCLILTTIFFLNKNAPDGALAEHSELVRSLQKDIGSIISRLGNINDDTTQIARHAKTTADNTTLMVEQGKVLADLLVLMVNPDDAKKKLMHQSIPYTIDGYTSKINESDLPALQLFYRAGWNPGTKNSMGVIPLYEAMVNETPYYPAMILQALKSSSYNFNALHDSKLLMDTQSLKMINYFGYTIVQNLSNFGADPIQNIFYVNIPLNLGKAIAINFPIIPEDIVNIIKNNDIDTDEGVKWRNNIASSYENALNNGLAHYNKINKENGKKDYNYLTIDSIYTPTFEKEFRAKIKEFNANTQKLIEARKFYLSSNSKSEPGQQPQKTQPSWKTEPSKPQIWQNK